MSVTKIWSETQLGFVTNWISGTYTDCEKVTADRKIFRNDTSQNEPHACSQFKATDERARQLPFRLL